MATNAVLMKVDGERVAQAFAEARENLESAQAELVLDLSAVHRLDAAGLRAMERLADAVDGTETRLILTNINIDIYRALKLAKLAARFDFRV